ncbi:MAG TPA: hypothetical protein VK694_07665 [Verrucomicrobiae bacterium]|nr:hypothetical protein [Verrucomicrobiae bacterium]
METAQEMILLGLGFVVGGLLLVMGMLFHVFPDSNRAKRLWAIIIPGIIIGLALILSGSLMK